MDMLKANFITNESLTRKDYSCAITIYVVNYGISNFCVDNFCVSNLSVDNIYADNFFFVKFLDFNFYSVELCFLLLFLMIIICWDE